MKQIFIINGPAGVGKDTFINLCRESLKDYGIEVFSFSSVDEVKEILKRDHGWDGVTKDSYWRNRMVELKQQMIEDGDRPTHFLLERINEVDQGLVFLHIREPEEMQKIIRLNTDIQTIHVERPQAEIFDNSSDAATKKFKHYNIEIVNNFETEEEFRTTVVVPFIKQLGFLSEHENFIDTSEIPNN